MCTSIAFPERELYGRNLDLEYHFGERIVVTPRGHAFSFRHLEPMDRHYAMIGMATVAGDTPLYAEAVNEKGLYMAGLYFPGSACYFERPAEGRLNAAPWELIPMILGGCATLAEARGVLERLRVLAEPFAPGYPLAALHWQIAARDGFLIAEPRQDGLRLYEDRLGVLTNEPPYPQQLLNLSGYRGLSPELMENRLCPGVELPVYGQGLGAFGLPGGRLPDVPLRAHELLQEPCGHGTGQAGGDKQVFPPARLRRHGEGQRRHARGPVGRDHLFLLRRRPRGGLLLQNLRQLLRSRRAHGHRGARRRAAGRIHAGEPPAVPLRGVTGVKLKYVEIKESGEK